MRTMTSMERVLTALSYKEPDRVPVFLMLTMHGAKELGLSLKEYFSSGENVAKGQLRLRHKYGHDCLYPFFYAALEVEARGGEVIYYDDGPANSGEPFLKSVEEIMTLEPIHVKDTKCLHKVLKAIELLKEESVGQVPIIGVVMSPFSLPVMQLGFEKYIEVLYERPELFAHLMRINEAFAVEWANAQLAAGATVICYFDPLSSPTIIPIVMLQNYGLPVAIRVMQQIKGPTATHLASGRSIPIIEEFTKTGTAVISSSILEDIRAMKSACKGKITVLGNLNGIEMVRWTEAQTRDIVRETIRIAAPGGGFILSDNHGELPYDVTESTLQVIMDTVRIYGKYPIE